MSQVNHCSCDDVLVHPIDSRPLNQPTNRGVRRLLHVNRSSGGVDAVPAGSQSVAATTSNGAKQSPHPSDAGSFYSHGDYLSDDSSAGVEALDHVPGYNSIIPDVGRLRAQNQFLPFSTVTNNQERILFCSHVLQKKSPFQHLLEDSIFNLGFVYEEGNTDFKAGDSNGELTGLGELSLQRWKCGITTIHFLFPSEKQASNTRTANGPHYQATFLDLVRTMEQYEASGIRFVFYDPNKDHSTDFLFVLNGDSADEYTRAIPWKKIKKRIKADHRPAVTVAKVRQAPGNYADYGFCTSQNSNRKESMTGHAMPALKPNSLEPDIIHVFVTLTNFGSNTRPRWRLDEDHFASMDPIGLSEFSQKIDERNKLPSLHLATTSLEQPCGCHNDGSSNSKIHSDVVCVAIIDGDSRISCNAQQRKSIDDYRICCTEFGKPILAMEKVYGNMEPSRRSATQALFQGEQFMYVPGFMTIQNDCNMDPTSYSMTILDATVRLGQHYNLSFPELHSVQMAFHVLPNSCLLFGLPAKCYYT